MVYNHTFLVYLQRTVINLSDTDTSYILIIVNRADQHLSVCIWISLWCRNIIHNGFKKRTHIHFWILQLFFGKTGSCRCENKRAVQLLIRCIQIHKQLQNLINNLIRSGFRTINLIDADNNGKVQIQRSLQNKFCLRHGTLISVYNQNNSVYHLQNTLNLAAEICVSWCINNINLLILIENSCIF